MIRQIARTICTIASIIYSAETNSIYAELQADYRITSTTPTTLITKTIATPITQNILLSSDGRFFPNGALDLSNTAAIAGVFITVDGVQQSNLSLINWNHVRHPKQHSFNCIGLVTVPPGQHTVSLMAASLNGAPFYVGARSNLSIIVNPGKFSSVVTHNDDKGAIGFTTNGIKVGTPLPSIPILSLSIPVPYTGGQIIGLASSRIFDYAGINGDPLTAIYIDGAEPRNHEGNWSDNDMNANGETETQAPFFNHGYFQKSAGTHTLSYNASELSYGENTSASKENGIYYFVGAGSRLIGILGGRVTGRGYESTQSNNRTNYIPIASAVNWPGYPLPGTDVVIARGNIFVPSDHNGIVFFAGKTRVQGDPKDPAIPGFEESTYLWLTIDGAVRGSLGAQDIGTGDNQSTRTISTSFLAEGNNKLSFGNHVVELHAMALGGFAHFCMTQDLPLIWFD